MLKIALCLFFFNFGVDFDVIAVCLSWHLFIPDTSRFLLFSFFASVARAFCTCCSCAQLSACVMCMFLCQSDKTAIRK